MTRFASPCQVCHATTPRTIGADRRAGVGKNRDVEGLAPRIVNIGARRCATSGFCRRDWARSLPEPISREFAERMKASQRSWQNRKARAFVIDELHTMVG